MDGIPSTFTRPWRTRMRGEKDRTLQFCIESNKQTMNGLYLFLLRSVNALAAVAAIFSK
jgi:hypothetical protein